MTLFELAAKLTLDTSEFESSLRDAKQLAQTTDSTVKSSIATTTAASTGTMAKGVAFGMAAYNTITSLASAVWEGGQDLITTAADIRAENAQYAATLGDMASEADAAFSKIGKDANILDTRLRRVGVQGFSQFVAAGMDSTEALSSMELYTQLAADGAAYLDLSLEEVSQRIRSFVRGNTEAGEEIRLFTSQTDREMRAMDLYGAAWKDLTEAQREYIMLGTAKEIYDQIGATGQAAREADTWANVTGNLSEAWTQAKAILGSSLVESITPALERLTDWLTNNPETLAAVGDVLGQIGGMTFDGLISLLTFVADRGADIISFFSWLGGAGGGQVATGQTFGDANAYKAAEEWRKAAYAYDTSGTDADQAAQTAAWSKVEASMGGQEFADTFSNAFSQYLQENGLDYSAEIPAEWFEGTEDLLQEDLDKMELGADLNADFGEGTEAALQSALDGFDLRTTVSLSPVFSGFGSLLSSFAKNVIGLDTGMDYIPYDDYPARLHEGEAVLTKIEADKWRSGETSSLSNDRVISLLQSVDSKLSSMQTMKIFMDSNAVGEAVAETVSRRIAKKAYEGRY